MADILRKIARNSLGSVTFEVNEQQGRFSEGVKESNCDRFSILFVGTLCTPLPLVHYPAAVSRFSEIYVILVCLTSLATAFCSGAVYVLAF